MLRLVEVKLVSYLLFFAGLYGVSGEEFLIEDVQTEFVKMYENVTLPCNHTEVCTVYLPWLTPTPLLLLVLL